MAVTIRPYQEKQIQAVEAGVKRGLQRMLVTSPTGTGKTVTLCELLHRWTRGRKLVVAHRDEIIQQTVAKVFAATGAYPGVVKADSNNYSQEVTVASIQTLANETRTRAMMGRDGFSLVVVDEAHHCSGTNTYKRVLEQLGAWEDGGPVVVGFTATGFRGDDAALGDVFQEIVYERGILPFIAEGYLVPPYGEAIRIDANFSELKVSRGDFTATSAEQVLMDGGAPGYAAKAYVERAAGRTAVVFTPTVAVSKAVEEEMRALGVAVAHVDGETPTEERRSILRKLEAGEIKVVTNCSVLTEGWDCPLVSCAIIARPTKSKVLYTQMIGRILRTHPQSGKEDALILDLVGNIERNDLLTGATLFGVTPATMAKRGGLMAALQERETRQVLLGRIVAEEVQLFDRAAFHWVNVPDEGRFIASLGEEGNLLVSRSGQTPEGVALYDIYKVSREKTAYSKWPQNVKKKLYASITLDVAMGVSEDLVRRAGKVAAIFNDRNARWRKDPASDGQRNMLIKARKWREGMTKGEAADVITRIKVR